MTNEQKIQSIEETMELDPGILTPETLLDDLEEWDSLAFLSFTVIMSEQFGKEIPRSTLLEQKTVGDLMKLMEKA